MNVDDIIKKWHVAAYRAECETEDRFDHQMCNIKNTDGVTECPICYFSKRLRYHLDLDAAQQAGVADVPHAPEQGNVDSDQQSSQAHG